MSRIEYGDDGLFRVGNQRFSPPTKSGLLIPNPFNLLRRRFLAGDVPNINPDTGGSGPTPPPSDNFKARFVMLGGSEEFVALNGSTILTQAEVRSVSSRANVREVHVGEGVTELALSCFNQYATGVDIYSFPSTLNIMRDKCLAEPWKGGVRPDEPAWFHPLSTFTIPHIDFSIGDQFLYFDFASSPGVYDMYWPKGSIERYNSFRYANINNTRYFVFDELSSLRNAPFANCNAKVVLTQKELPASYTADGLNGLGSIYVNTSVTPLADWKTAFSGNASKIYDWNGSLNFSPNWLAWHGIDMSYLNEGVI